MARVAVVRRVCGGVVFVFACGDGTDAVIRLYRIREERDDASVWNEPDAHGMMCLVWPYLLFAMVCRRVRALREIIMFIDDAHVHATRHRFAHLSPHDHAQLYSLYTTRAPWDPAVACFVWVRQ